MKEIMGTSIEFGKVEESKVLNISKYRIKSSPLQMGTTKINRKKVKLRKAKLLENINKIKDI
jgi:hypothetical protein